MTIEQRMEKLEKAFGAQDTLVKELREAVTVTAELEARQGRVVREHGDWLAEQEKERERDQQEWRQKMTELDRRIADLVSGFGEFLRRQQQPGL